MFLAEVDEEKGRVDSACLPINMMFQNVMKINKWGTREGLFKI